MEVLDETEVDRRLGDGPWQRRGREIVRELEFPGFAAAVAFVEEVAEAAESANHHPDILVHSYNRVRLTLSTHSAGGITDADLALAATIDGLT